jgi:hypothetical protein
MDRQSFNEILTLRFRNRWYAIVFICGVLNIGLSLLLWDLFALCGWIVSLCFMMAYYQASGKMWIEDPKKPQWGEGDESERR